MCVESAIFEQLFFGAYFPTNHVPARDVGLCSQDAVDDHQHPMFGKREFFDFAVGKVFVGICFVPIELFTQCPRSFLLTTCRIYAPCCVLYLARGIRHTPGPPHPLGTRRTYAARRHTSRCCMGKHVPGVWFLARSLLITYRLTP